MSFAMLHGYFDESGKFKDHDVISLCGWIGQLQDWELLAQEWQDALTRHDLTDIHMAQMKGQDRVLEEFADIIKGRVICGVGSALNTKLYRSMPETFQKRAGHPHFLVFSAVIKQAIDRIEEFAKHVGLGKDVFLSLIFDQDEQLSQECFRLLNKLKKIDSRVRERVTGVCFCNRRQLFPLQAADMIAYETRAEIDRRANHPEQQVSRLFSRMSTKHPSGKPDGFYNGVIYDKKELERTANLWGIKVPA